MYYTGPGFSVTWSVIKINRRSARRCLNITQISDLNKWFKSNVKSCTNGQMADLAQGTHSPGHTGGRSLHDAQTAASSGTPTHHGGWVVMDGGWVGMELGGVGGWVVLEAESVVSGPSADRWQRSSRPPRCRQYIFNLITLRSHTSLPQPPPPI